MVLPRVVYLSAPPLGEQMLEWLRTQPCELVGAFTLDQRPDDLCSAGPIDLGLNFLGSHRISATAISNAKFGFVNFHPAPLPEFGGRNVAYHAIMEDAKEFGATVHYMDQDFDTGEIIEVRRFPIQPTDTAGDLMEKSKALLMDMFKFWVPQLLKGEVPSTPQNGKTKYYKKTDIDGFILLTAEQKKMLRALTCHPKHHAKVSIGDDWYSIVKDEE